MLNLSFPGPGKNASYHNHSLFSDGTATPEAMVRAAKAAGLKEFGLSDHMVCPPEGVEEVSWSMKWEHLKQYVEILQKLKKVLEDESFTLKIGLEVDFFFENASDVVKKLRSLPLDYLIGGVHIAGTFPVDHSIGPWLELTLEERDAVCETYWKKVQGAAESGLFDFIAHLDLPKKFGVIDQERYFSHAFKLLELAQKSHTAIELNTAGWFKECNEQYPNIVILKEACRREIPVFISADAHDPNHVNRNFDLAEKVLKEAGYPL